MPLRWQEISAPLVLIVVLLLLKHVPIAQGLPLSRAAGVVAFGFAACLALRLMQDEKARNVDGWSELSPSIAQYFVVYGSTALAMGLLSTMIVMSRTKIIDPTQMIAAFIAALGLAATAAVIGLTGLSSKTRWNGTEIVHAPAFGRPVSLLLSEIVAVEPSWRGVTISSTSGQAITVSQFNQGAAELCLLATTRAVRNGETASQAFASL